MWVPMYTHDKTDWNPNSVVKHRHDSTAFETSFNIISFGFRGSGGDTIHQDSIAFLYMYNLHIIRSSNNQPISWLLQELTIDSPYFPRKNTSFAMPSLLILEYNSKTPKNLTVIDDDDSKSSFIGADYFPMPFRFLKKFRKNIIYHDKNLGRFQIDQDSLKNVKKSFMLNDFMIEPPKASDILKKMVSNVLGPIILFLNLLYNQPNPASKKFPDKVQQNIKRDLKDLPFDQSKIDSISSTLRDLINAWIISFNRNILGVRITIQKMDGDLMILVPIGYNQKLKNSKKNRLILKHLVLNLSLFGFYILLSEIVVNYRDLVKILVTSIRDFNDLSIFNQQ